MLWHGWRLLQEGITRYDNQAPVQFDWGFFYGVRQGGHLETEWRTES